MPNTLPGLILLAVSASAFAQQPPGAGTQLQQIPALPALPGTPPELRMPPLPAPTPLPSDGPAITLKRLQLRGQHAYSEAQLVAVSGFQPDAPVTLAQLHGMAGRIAAFYQQHGYFLARAVLPPQDVDGGVLTITVHEGQYARITLRNHSAMADAVAQSLLAGLAPGDPVLIAPLESRLLQLSDLPGLRVASTLVPGAAAGSTELLVDLAPGPRFSGSVDADNHGNRYTGKSRIGATLNANQLAGLGDVLTLRAMTSAAGLNYGRLAYQLQAGRASVGAAYAAMDYELGRDFAALQAHGSARITSVYGAWPLLRSRSANLSAHLGMDAKKLQDRQDVGPSVIDKKARVLTASLNGDLRGIGTNSGGSSRAALTLSSGSIDILSPDARALDAATARVDGHFGKLAYALSHLQQWQDGWSGYASLSGQLASTNLDASEKMGLGGAGAVRAFPEGEAYADRAAVLTFELKKAMGAQLQLVGFLDGGTATLDKSPWSPGRRHRSLSGAGVGLEWAGPHNLLAKAYLAHQLGGGPATSAPDRKYRLALEAVTYF